MFLRVSVSVSKNLVSEKVSVSVSENLVSKKSLGIGLGKFGLEKNHTIGLGKLVSDKKSRFRSQKIWSRIKSLGIGIGQNFGLVTQCFQGV